jgi:hypothetical protein
MPATEKAKPSKKSKSKGPSKPTPKAKTKAKTSAGANVLAKMKVDPALKRAYDHHSAIIAKTTKEEMKDFDARWEAAGAIVDHDPPLYLAAGYKNSVDFFRSVMHEEPRNAQRYIRVARFATPMEEEIYGISKLDAAIAYIEARIGAKVEHPPLPVAFDLLQIPVGSKTKSLRDATAAEITAATKALGAKRNKHPKHALHAGIERAMSKVASLSDVAVTEHGGLLTFKGVPIAALTHFLRALTHANAKRG